MVRKGDFLFQQHSCVRSNKQDAKSQKSKHLGGIMGHTITKTPIRWETLPIVFKIVKNHKKQNNSPIPYPNLFFVNYPPGKYNHKSLPILYILIVLNL